VSSGTFAHARRRVQAQLVGARHVQFSAVDDPSEPGGAGALTYVSYFAHRIGNHFITRSGYAFVLSNGFLQSHIYNLALANIVFSEDSSRLEQALLYNYKKFYAECCLGAGNCFIGRALLLETMLFEQDAMIEAFDKADEEIARRIAGAMTAILNQHELNHHFVDRYGDAWWAKVRTLYDGRMRTRLERWARTYRQDLVVEMACDAVAISALISDMAGVGVGFNRVARARMAVFCFLAFRDLAALERSGHEAARLAIAEDRDIAVGSEYRRSAIPSVPRGRVPDMEIRCEEALRIVVEELASDELYGLDGEFPLSEETDYLLRRAFDLFDGTSETGGLVTARQRGLVQIVAEAMHGHDAGAEHLLWRSKKYLVGGRSIDP